MTTSQNTADTQTRISLQENWTHRAQAHGLVHVDGHSDRSILAGTLAQWGSFYRETSAAHSALKGSDKCSSTAVLGRVGFQLRAALTFRMTR